MALPTRHQDIARLRLVSQHLAGTTFTTPLAVVKHFGAIQAQDFPASLWAIGQRTRACDQVDVEQALIDGTVVRTWPMRGTLHMVPAADARWMMELMGSRMLARMGPRQRSLGLTPQVIAKSATLITTALRDGAHLTRPQIYDVLQKSGIATQGSRGLHILGELALERLICFGPRQGKQHTFVLFDGWLPKAKSLPRQEALATITRRYFTSHGPATIADMMWWAGLPARDIKEGIALAGNTLVTHLIDGNTYYAAATLKAPAAKGTAYLSAAFDEYFVGYKNRSAIIHADHATHVNPGANGMISPTTIVDGQIFGTWRRTLVRDAVMLTFSYFKHPTPAQHKAIARAAQRYGAFLGLSVILPKSN